MYWFKYEDIVWDVGKNENSEVTLISHTILDSRKFYIDSNEERTIDKVTVYPNNYEHSTIRELLNEGFYNTAFTTAKEQNAILLREVDNSVGTTNAVESRYISNNTNDKIFLLSYKDLNENTTTYDITTRKQGGDYAKAQGALVSSMRSSYLLRSPSSYARSSIVTLMGGVSEHNIGSTNYGVVPALKMSL